MCVCVFTYYLYIHCDSYINIYINLGCELFTKSAQY